MSSFSQLPQAIDPGIAQSAVLSQQPDATAFADEQMRDDVALGTVLQDTQSAMAYLQSKTIVPFSIDATDDVVRAYVRDRKWPNGNPKANLQFFTVLEAIEKLLPTLYLSLFGSGRARPFAVEPKGKSNPDAARAKAVVLEWAVKESGLKEEIRRMLKTILTYGFGVGFWGWESKTIRKRGFKKLPDGKIEREWQSLDYSVPCFDNMKLKNMLIDPHCDRQDVQKGAAFVVKQMMITANDLDDMRKDPTYKNIPSNEELRRILTSKSEPAEDSLQSNQTVWREFQAQLQNEASSVDPLRQPLELLEYWTPNRVITVLQRCLVIRNSENEFGEIPALSCAFVDILGSAWGFGVARLLSGEQKFQTAVGNNWIDSLNLVLNPSFQAIKGEGVGTSNIMLSPGKIITTSGELKPLAVPDVSATAMNAIASSEERANKRVAANGGSNLPDQALRTGTGVNALTGDVTTRIQYFLEQFINLVYVPVLEKFLFLCFEHLEPEQINMILTDAQGKAWEGDVLDLYEAECSIDVLGGANLVARQASAQLAPLLLQSVQSGPVAQQLEVQGTYFDYQEFVEELFDLSGWDVPVLFKPMTPQMLQAVQQKNAAMTRVQGDMQLQAAKHQDDLELANEKGTVQAGVALVKQSAKAHMDHASKLLDNLQNPTP